MHQPNSLTNINERLIVNALSEQVIIHVVGQTYGAGTQLGEAANRLIH
jgi:hypothetical protein